MIMKSHHAPSTRTRNQYYYTIIGIVLTGLLLISTIERYFPLCLPIGIDAFTGNQLIRISFLTPVSILFSIRTGVFRRWVPFSLSAVCTGLLLFELFTFLPIFNSNRNPVISIDSLTVITLNTQAGFAYGNLLPLLEDNPEILILQEVEEGIYDDLRTRMNNLGYQSAVIRVRDVGSKQLVLFVKGEIESAYAVGLQDTDGYYSREQYQGCMRRYLEACVTIRGRRYIINAVHLEPPLLEGNWQGMFRRSAIRVRQTMHIRNRILQHETLPTIIAGDCNATPTERCMRAFYFSTNDSWRSVGRGFGATWYRETPMHRIDYIFTRNNLVAESVQIRNMGHGDHKALVAHLLVCNE